MTKDADTDVVIQAMLTLSAIKAPDLPEIIKGAQSASKARGVKEIGDFLMKPAPPPAGGVPLAPEDLKMIEEGGTIYASLCASCHGPDGRGAAQGRAPAGMLGPSLAGSPRVNGHRDYVVKVLLKGLTGPLEPGDASGDVMVPMGTNTDAWVASISSYVRTSFGNAGGLVRPADVTRVRAATANRRAAVDAEGSRADAAAPARTAGDMEVHRQPQHRGRLAGADDEALDTRRASGPRPVVPGRAAAAGDA